MPEGGAWFRFVSKKRNVNIWARSRSRRCSVTLSRRTYSTATLQS